MTQYQQAQHAVVMNPYMGNPNVVTLNWNYATHGFDENDPGFTKMEIEGFDPIPTKRVIAEIHALRDEMNFKDKLKPIHCLVIILCVVLIFPWFCVCWYMIAKSSKWIAQIDDFRTKSQAIINKHNQEISKNSRYYVEAGQHYPHWLFVHLVRVNQPGMPQMMMNNPGMNQDAMMNNQMMMA